jgi:plasmid stabilization system protein ParE
MKYRISVLTRAKSDLKNVFDWLAKRSPAGAAAWYEVAIQAIDDLRNTADQHGLALESRRLHDPIREKLFKTKRGRRYRLLYRIDGDVVRVLRVRGPGQPPVRRRDLK